MTNSKYAHHYYLDMPPSVDVIHGHTILNEHTQVVNLEDLGLQLQQEFQAMLSQQNQQHWFYFANHQLVVDIPHFKFLVVNVNEFHYKKSEKFSELHPYFFVVFMNLLNLLQFYTDLTRLSEDG